MLSLFSREPNPEHDTIAPYLLRSPIDEEGICLDFIKEAIKRFDDDEAFPAIFNDAMVKISTQLASMSMGDDYKPHVQVSLFPLLLSAGSYTSSVSSLR
jgi:ubiquitin conjugation factor E4 B